MKVIINFFAVVGVVVIMLFFISFLPVSQNSNIEQIMKKNNYDGSYNIDYGNSRCGNFGYRFKNNYERYFDETKDAGSIRKSNCKSVNGLYHGYIYPAKKPHLRLHWQELENGNIVLIK